MGSLPHRDATLITIAVLLGNAAGQWRIVSMKPVIIKGSEPDSSLTVQLSKDGKKFRATIEIEFDKSKPCSGP